MQRHREDCAHQAQQHLPVLCETAANAKTRAKKVIWRPIGWHGPAAVHAAVGAATPRWRLHTSTLGFALAVLAFLATLSSIRWLRCTAIQACCAAVLRCLVAGACLCFGAPASCQAWLQVGFIVH